MSKLQNGDRVEVTVVGNVRHLRSGGKFIELDNDVYLYTGTPGIKVRRLSRPKPKQGAIITGKQVQDTWWKRGTIFRFAESDGGRAPFRPPSGLVLRADGLLYPLDNAEGDEFTFRFSDLNPGAKFELIFVA